MGRSKVKAVRKKRKTLIVKAADVKVGTCFDLENLCIIVSTWAILTEIINMHVKTFSWRNVLNIY